MDYIIYYVIPKICNNGNGSLEIIIMLANSQVYDLLLPDIDLIFTDFNSTVQLYEVNNVETTKF